MKRILFAVAVLAALGLTACGSASTSNSCCVNGKAFTCDSADNATKCSQGTTSACTANPSMNSTDGGLTCTM